ncbi:MULTISPECIES: phytoene desaturase family protein [Pontibacillus]|uniref:NAD(P)/FAD-dependent oxidoreductase n=1 Tax=Pontibacillus chungwhensis TaxID=265426 RepID=A0ABY8V009_9BACI|nr:MULTISPECIES: NAD(P)/FAD-dependent oxidoreductase [Pontibacillus]MCD5323959.1 NAD(P)/FAD-dependent oxidoreductase [Pontibacillus sp. HN14]WIF97975.1 NAD(P)/FAD-dependent oxidoreductase [Pontibacillus chungwhensis]
MERYDVIVVGAGFGGLTSAALLAKAGFSVGVLEASNELGGCAGKFDRHGYRFGAGATVGMGFEEGGVLKRLFEELDVELPPMTSLDTIMNIYTPHDTIHYYQETERWFQEVDRVFPNRSEQVKRFYNEVFKIGERIDRLLLDLPVFPPNRWRDWPKLFKYVNANSVALTPYLTQTVMDRLKAYNLHQDEMFLSFLNGQLMDSVQTTAAHCPAFLGYAALQTFHKGAFSVEGGLATIAEKLADSIKANGGDVLLRRPAQRIVPQVDGWMVSSRRERQYQAGRVILNNSLHNFHHLFEDSVHKQSVVQKDDLTASWGAFMLYLGVEDVYPGDVLYHQIIQDQNKPLSEGNQFLLSFSGKNDRRMAPENKRAITISTHTEVAQWWKRDDYEALKETYTERILTGIEQYFPSFRSTIDVLMPGTPVTFERFVKRDKGRVGGYIPDGRFSWLKSQSIYTGLEGVYACGDTVFPGAGTLGTSLSGWMVANEIQKS